MSLPLSAVVVGFGKIAAGYAQDRATARYFSYATHAQVLADNPSYRWEAVVDISDEALELARTRWKVPYVAKSLDELKDRCEPEVAVVATPPGSRLEIIKRLPDLRAVLVEKPLGLTVSEAERFLEECDRREILVQVNLWRRADETFRRLASGHMADLIGEPQAAFGTYGNGLINNGTHLVDFARMMFGEVETVQATSGKEALEVGPIPGDCHASFSLGVPGGPAVAIQPVDFNCYREIGLDVWGTEARLAIMNEGLSILVYPRHPHRAMEGEWEIGQEAPQVVEPTVGRALYHLYDNLAAAVRQGEPLWSPGTSALQTAKVVQGILQSAEANGSLVKVA